MGRHAAPGPIDAPQPDPPVEDHTPGPVASLLVGLLVALATAAVLRWAGQSWTVAGLAGLGVLVVVLAAAWVARLTARRHPVQ